MTAATVTTRLRGPALAEENVVITVSDGETYVSELSTPLFCQLTWQETTVFGSSTQNDPGSCTISGRTITIVATSISDKKAALTIKGYL